jgi:Protein of unknown function (DUF3071)
VVAGEVIGLSDDGARLVLKVGDVTVEVPLEEIRRAERQRGRPQLPDEPLSPKVIQRRIRAGETAQAVADSGGWSVAVVRRYEGPVLAEREHQARQARYAQVDGHLVDDLVSGHLRQPSEMVTWDSWLVDEGRWEVQARAAGQVVRLSWNPGTGRVQALDEDAHRVLRVAHVLDDVLTAVLRPVSSARPSDKEEQPKAPRRLRAHVPDWADITQQVTGRDQPS